MRGRKKILSVVCVVALVFSLGNLAHASETSDEGKKMERAIEQFLETGMTRDEILAIYPMEDLIELGSGSEIQFQTFYHLYNEEGEISTVSENDIAQTPALLANPNTSSNGALKTRITFSQTEDGLYFCTGFFEWIIAPGATYTDVFGLAFPDITLNRISNRYYRYDKMYQLGTNITKVSSHSVQVNSYKEGAHAAAMSFALKSNPASISDVERYFYDNHSGYMSVYLEDPQASSIGISTVYYHASFVGSPSLSISYPASIGVGVSYSLVADEMDNNAYYVAYP